MEKIDLKSEIFTRAVVDIISEEDIRNKLSDGKKLRVKHGIDATARGLHIGNAASLWKIRALQEKGHKAIIILGDFTTKIGDPTGKSKTRPVLDKKTVEDNIKAIKKEVESVLINKSNLLEFRRNSEWYGKMPLENFLSLLSLITHARLIERDMFQERIKAGAEIFMQELIYPILQGYDSVMVKSDLTIIGQDQLFNEHMGRFFQEKFNQAPQGIISLSLLPGLKGGEKMSKSLGNYIALSDSPTEKFGKAMTINDSLIIPYLEAYTDVSEDKIKEIKKDLESGKNPKDAKMFFSHALVSRYHGQKIADKEKEGFIKTFSKKETPDNIREKKIKYGSWDILELLIVLDLVSSKLEARRLIHQGAVEINGAILKDLSKVEIKKDDIIRVGKHRFVKC